MGLQSLEDLNAALPRRARLLGLDHGSKNIGIAVSDPDRNIATPLDTIRVTKFSQDIEHLKRLMDDYQPAAIIIGLPVNMDGTEGPRCQSVRAFGRNLISRADFFGAEPVIAFWDERMSSAAVERMLINEADMNRKRRSEVVDKLAAAHILQGALDCLKNLQQA